MTAARSRAGSARATRRPVQGAIEAAVLACAGEAVTVFAAGRTDAGVHALGQVAHLDLTRAWLPERLAGALNFHLRPAPITVLEAREAAPDFHARFSCTGRRYLYRILARRSPPALERGRVWHVPVHLDAERMHVAAQALVGRHDFTSFRSSECQSASPVKTLGGIHVAQARRPDRMPPVGALVPAPPGAEHRRHAEDGRRGQGADRACARRCWRRATAARRGRRRRRRGCSWRRRSTGATGVQ